MAGSLYTGNMGAGKTYGAVRFGVIPALQRKQRVVTNIPLKLDALTTFLGFNLDGLLVVVTNEQVEAPGFWYSDDSPNAIVQPGDMVIIDEAWQFYGTDKKIKTDHPAFAYLRLHRKYTHKESGFSSEVWYVTQDFNDISRSFRSVCDFHLYMEKLKVTGEPSKFRVDYFANCRVAPTRQQPFKQQFYKYDPDYFGLYHSYASSSTSVDADKAGGVEVLADDRMNYWNQRALFGMLSLKQAMVLSGVIAVLCIGYLFYYFGNLYLNPSSAVHTSTAPKDATPAVAAEIANPGKSNAISKVSTPGTPASLVANVASPASESLAGESSQYRLVGIYRIDFQPVAVVVDSKNVYRHLSPFEFEEIQSGPVSYIRFNGQIVAPWTGPTPSLFKRMETSK